MNTKLKQHRTARGWTQDDLARRAGLARVTVARLEGRRTARQPALRTVVAVARALRVPVTDLLQ